MKRENCGPIKTLGLLPFKTLVTGLTANVSAFRDYTAGQSGGELEFHSGTLTRRQMAVFLSKALGLYWPD